MTTDTPAREDAREILDDEALGRTLARLAHEVIERAGDLEQLALVGIHTRGVPLARRLQALVAERSDVEPALGSVDISFHRDDVLVRGREAPLHPQPLVRGTELDFALEGRTCVLVDDVLYTGRTIRAAIEALLDYGRPARVQLAVLVDRGHRELPIRPDYVGKNLPTALRRARARRARGDRRQGSRPARAGSRRGTERDVTAERRRRHLLGVGDLTRDDAIRILDTARALERSLDREVKKLPTLRGRLVVNLFYESSTRTLSSFELAAKRLSADTMTLRSSGSSVEKGESLRDTAETLGAYDPDVIVIRHPHIGAPQLVAAATDALVVNAGDGKHQHPTQALLDLSHDPRGARPARGRERRDRRRRPALARRALADRGAAARRRPPGRGRAADAPAPGDRIARAARSATRSQPRPTSTSSTSSACSRSGWTPRSCPSLREYTSLYGITPSRVRPGQVVMHPGPMNRGVEIDPRVADSGASLITTQVRAGLVVRMAVLYDLLTAPGLHVALPVLEVA